jgi:hypothetical protein
MLLDKSPEYWAREASLVELRDAVKALPALDGPAAQILDFVYADRCVRALARCQDGGEEEAIALGDHLARVAHDSVRDELDRLGQPYFARWRLMAELARRAARRLEVPARILERRHVRAILVQLHRAGGALAQGELTMIHNEGQRSSTLKLMEQWELIERRARGPARMVAITALGRRAIADAVRAKAPSRALMRGSAYMYEVSAPS